jgi:hypothetical protein
MQIRAKMIEIFEIQQVTNTFKKREFVVEYAENPQYPEFMKFELIQDKCDILDDFSIGQEVEVHFNLKGRKWTNPKGEIVYFNTLQAWRILEASSQPDAKAQDDDSPLPDEPPPFLDDDIPF